jgi:hypothetical protein
MLGFLRLIFKIIPTIKVSEPHTDAFIYLLLAYYFDVWNKHVLYLIVRNYFYNDVNSIFIHMKYWKNNEMEKGMKSRVILIIACM